MSSASSDPAAQPSEPVGGVAAPVVRTVADDLESIFPSESEAAPPRSKRLRLGRRARGERKRVADRRAAGVGALVAAACIGVSAGALLARPGGPARTAPPPESPGVPIALATASPAPGPGPLAPMLANVEAPVLAPQAAAAPQVAGPEAAAVAAPAEAPQAEQLRRASADRPAHPRHLTRTAARCAHAAHCGSLSVADARLRRAYAAAEHAGVARPVLADYRGEWRSLRRRAPREPAVVAARYRQMAGDLNQLAARQRTARNEPPRAGPWRRFRMQLAALWR